MTDFEKYTLLIGLIGVLATIIIICIAIWGERIRQYWNKPKLKIELEEPNFNKTHSNINGWYYLISIMNEKRSVRAINVRLLINKIFKNGPDGNWREQKFSGPVQVSWQWSQNRPLYATLGPKERATFGQLLENSNVFKLQLYMYPNNLSESIQPNEAIRIEFQAVSDISESNILVIEIVWDGQWCESKTEMSEHCRVKTVYD